jgi:L-iditol 2-dehydrogenase
MHLQLARHQGGRVIACDAIEERLQLAARLGAHETVCVSQGNAIARVRDLTDGRGANAVLVAVGNVKAMEMALEIAGINATVNFFAGTYPPQTFPLDPNVIHYKQLNVTGSHDFTPHDFTTALKLIELGIVKVAPLITHRFPLERTAEAFDLVAERRGVKVMVEM